MAKKSAPKKNLPEISNKPDVFINPDTGMNITLTPEIISQMERLYRVGMQDNPIANMLGINPKLMREWLIRGATYNNGLHGELFRRCAAAVAGCELELFVDLRKHAMGTPAVYLESPVKDMLGNVQFDKQGKVIMEVVRDADGKPIVKTAEVKGNPMWITWILERRFHKTFGKQMEVGFTNATPDNAFIDAMLNPDSPQKDANEPIDINNMNDAEDIKILEAALKAKKLRAANGKA